MDNLRVYPAIWSIVVKIAEYTLKISPCRPDEMAYVDFDGCEPILSQTKFVTACDSVNLHKNNDRLILSNYTILSFFDIVEKSNRNSKNKQPKVKAKISTLS